MGLEFLGGDKNIGLVSESVLCCVLALGPEEVMHVVLLQRCTLEPCSLMALHITLPVR